MNTGGDGRTLQLVQVAQSSHTHCRVCDGLRRVGLVALDGLRGAGQVACPHCTSGRHPALPIYDYPQRDDRPGGDAA